MKILALFVLLLSGILQASTVFKDETIKLIPSGQFTESDLKDKVVLVTNIATQCGYTGQLDDLEALYQKYKSKGLILLGVPSNDFGGQTPEGNEEVAKFCKLNYGVTFPLSFKQVVSGEGKTELIKKLISSDPKKMGEIKWNFEKFIVDKSGNVVGRFRSDTKPLSEDITKLIESKL